LIFNHCRSRPAPLVNLRPNRTSGA